MRPEPPVAQTTAPAVLVAGAGAAGLAAAIAATRQGVQVLLVEKSSRLGGTVTHSLIHTLAGLHDAGGELINGGLPEELTERLIHRSPLATKRRIGRTWTLSVDPCVYEQVVGDWLTEQKGLTLLRNASVIAVTGQGRLVQSVDVVTGGKTVTVQPQAVVDATGTAEIVRQFDPGLVEDDRQAAAGLIFTLAGVDTSVLRFPRGLALLQVIRKAAGKGRLPRDCGKAWLDLGVRDDEAYVKLFLPLVEGWRVPGVLGNAQQHGLLMRDALVDFLRTCTGFEKAEPGQTGALGIREGGRVKGEYCLTEDDVLNGRQFDDGIGRCCWPIEYWDPEKGVTLQYLPAGVEYEIPLRALRVRYTDNFWVAGKCFSAEPRAQASARVAGACWAMGEAAGKAAAGSGAGGGV